MTPEHGQMYSVNFGGSAKTRPLAVGFLQVARHLSIRALVATLSVSSLLTSAADTEWKPKPDESYVVGDPRFEAEDAYRDAEIIMRVYSDIRSGQKTPGDAADQLVTDFQPIAARYILKPFQFLLRYPESELTTQLLRFQITQTSGTWPPWKLLALRIFNEHPESFASIFQTLPVDQKKKLSADIRLGFAMLSDGPLSYPLTTAERDALKRKIAELPK